ncbi:DNRLRE domain-containing protein [Nonomuraea sp. KC401]|uniref:heparinase II/III family protein n=1 Tax=unclassified Nonomuraea TaxID=2593643 RepID=UPI0010FE4199|nr:heparinase II/III family protein [Nonomuraea sp. KC401]NBE98446.1 DNRLRE domain-containing protein [Nonomuraea sp. K271]TLF60999.1 DNRLRE domain-containing protein [Nonomuraea sp. KC401]
MSLRRSLLRTFAALTLAAALLVPGPQAAAASLSDAEFFGKWSNGAWVTAPRVAYDEGLDEVQRAVKDGDYGLAKQKLLDHFRERPAMSAGRFSHSAWPGVLELTPDHIWTLDTGEVYLTTLTVGPQETTVRADVTTSVKEGRTGFFLMSRYKDPVIARFGTSKRSSGTPTLRLTLADGSEKTLRPSHDTYIWAGHPGTAYGDKYLMQVSDQGKGPFSAETRKAYLQFDLAGLPEVKKAELSLTGSADAKKDVMLYGNGDTFTEASRTWSNTVQYTYSWQGDPGGFDWKQPAGADKEYLVQLPRFYFAGPLAEAYRQTGDKKHAGTLIDLMTDFVKDADTYVADGAGAYPNSLSVARRVQNWIAAYEILRTSPSLTPEANTEILKALNRSAAHLEMSEQGAHNWRQTQKAALLHTAVYFPEFSRAPQWKANAVTSLERLLDESTYADGGYWEATDGYARAYASQYVDLALFMSEHGLAFSEAARARLRKLGRFLMDQTYPNGYGPVYGDSEPRDVRSTLRRLGELVDDEELIHVGTSGASGKKPAHTSALYPDTRVAVARSGWSPGDSYLRINADRGNHSHTDELAITAYAYGTPLLPDMGTFTYASDPRATWLRKSTESHNTIEIDNQAQVSTAAGAITSLISNSSFSLVGAHTEASEGALHERSVLSLSSGLWLVSDRLKPSDNASHRYEQNWHFTPDANLSLGSGRKAATTAFGDGANITVVPADPGKVSASLRDGYYAPAMYRVENAKYASYVKTTAGRTTFDTLLLPSKGAADRTVTVERIPVGSTPAHQATALGLKLGERGEAVYYKSWTTRASRSFGAYTFDGKLLYAETGATGQSIMLVDGTSVKRDGATLVTSPTPVKDLAVAIGKDGTVRIDGAGLKASTDPARAIAITTADAAKVVLNGTQVPFHRAGSLIYAAAAR